MPSGGARGGSGPAPDRGSRRQTGKADRSGWVSLPIGGRQGELPAWPLSRATKFEREQWAVLWRKPQAIMWERLGFEIQVAIYVRTLRDASKAGAAATRVTALLRQGDSLGLSPEGLAKNRWYIVDEPAASSAPARPAGSSAKDRLKVIGGTDARAS